RKTPSPPVLTSAAYEYWPRLLSSPGSKSNAYVPPPGAASPCPASRVKLYVLLAAASAAGALSLATLSQLASSGGAASTTTRTWTLVEALGMYMIDRLLGSPVERRVSPTLCRRRNPDQSVSCEQIGNIAVTAVAATTRRHDQAITETDWRLQGGGLASSS